MGTGSFPWVKWPGREVDQPTNQPTIAVVKDQAYTSTPLLGLRSLFRFSFTLTFGTCNRLYSDFPEDSAPVPKLVAIL